MPHLYLASDNRAVAHPFRTRREREASRTRLGIVGVSGGRLLPVVISSRPVPGSYADHRQRADERRNPTPTPDYVQPPCDVE